MRFDYGAADGQSHSDTFWFGREKGRKQLGRFLGVDSRAGVGDGHQNLTGFRKLRLNHQPPGLVFETSHGLRGIDRKVQDHLLQLNPIAERGWKIRGKFGVQRDTFSLHFAAE